ncbi:MAG: PEP-CTERM sorting domain-containing protein [Nitrospirae bacterium]|nr:PEP-CTERM sorting domain-containing protein [Nitrospirota bacterium]
MSHLKKLSYVLLIILVAGFLETASATQVMFHQNNATDSFFDITYRIDSNNQMVGSFFDVFFDTKNNSFFDVTYGLSVPPNPMMPNSFFDVFFDIMDTRDSFFDITYRVGTNPVPPDSFFDVFRNLYPPDPGAPADSFFDVFVTVNSSDSFFDVFAEVSLDAGNRTFDTGTQSFLIVNKVPEPSTVLLMISGLLGLVIFRRYRACR